MDKRQSGPSHDLGDLYRYIDTRVLDRIVTLAPLFKTICKDAGFNSDPPACLSDFMFCALVTCFANPFRREILRQVILDCLNDRQVEMADAPKKEVES